MPPPPGCEKAAVAPDTTKSNNAQLPSQLHSIDNDGRISKKERVYKHRFATQKMQQSYLLRRRRRRRIVRNSCQRSFELVQPSRHIVHYPNPECISLQFNTYNQIITPGTGGGVNHSHFPNISLETLSNLCCSWSRSSSTAALNWPCASMFCTAKNISRLYS